MNPADFMPIDLLEVVANYFDRQSIRYYVVGSMASIIYGETRFTNDIDMVANLDLTHVFGLCQHFTALDCYLSAAAVRDAIRQRFQFNIIHTPSGLKVDVFVPKDSPFVRSEAERVRQYLGSGENLINYASPEGVILNKLVYYKMSNGTSQKHLRDIAGMLKIMQDAIDRTYIATWAPQLGVQEEWNDLITQVDTQ